VISKKNFSSTVTNDARNEQRGWEYVKEYASTLSRIKVFADSTL